MMIASLRSVELLRESTYGADPGGHNVFPAFLQGDQWATRQRELLTSTVSRGAYGAAKVRPGMLQSAFDPIRTYLYDRGPAEMAWTMLLEAAGLITRDVNTWEAVPARHTSLTLRDYHDGSVRLVTGCRANLTLLGEAGGPVAVQASLAGRGTLDRPLPFPGGTLNLPAPATLCNIDLTISVDGQRPFVPRLDTLQLDTGTALVMRRPSRALEDGLEWRVGDVLPTFQCTVEAEKARDWEATRGRYVAIEWGVGEVGRWRFQLPRLQLVDDPQSVRLPSGNEGVALVFRARDGRGSPLRVLHAPS